MAVNRCLLALILSLVAFQNAFAQCETTTVVVYQIAVYASDGYTSYQILDIYDYTVCAVHGGTISPSDGGGGPTPIPPSVSIAFVDTSDPNNPIVAIDVTSNDPNTTLDAVVLELNGTTQDYSNFLGTARYQLHFPAIYTFGDNADVTFDGKACTVDGVCSQSDATIARGTPSPDRISETFTASWQEPDEKGPMTRSATYSHLFQQTYTWTSFTCMEVGNTSAFAIKHSLATISGHDPLPIWNASAHTSGTTNGAYYLLLPEPGPACDDPIKCSSQGGSAPSLTYGSQPTVDESIGSLVIEGYSALFYGGHLSLSFSR